MIINFTGQLIAILKHMPRSTLHAHILVLFHLLYVTGSLLVAVGSEDCSITLVSVTDTECEYTEHNVYNVCTYSMCV